MKLHSEDYVKTMQQSSDKIMSTIIYIHGPQRSDSKDIKESNAVEKGARAIESFCFFAQAASARAQTASGPGEGRD